MIGQFCELELLFFQMFLRHKRKIKRKKRKKEKWKEIQSSSMF